MSAVCLVAACRKGQRAGKDERPHPLLLPERWLAYGAGGVCQSFRISNVELVDLTGVEPVGQPSGDATCLTTGRGTRLSEAEVWWT